MAAVCVAESADELATACQAAEAVLLTLQKDAARFRVESVHLSSSKKKSKKKPEFPHPEEWFGAIDTVRRGFRRCLLAHRYGRLLTVGMRGPPICEGAPRGVWG